MSPNAAEAAGPKAGPREWLGLAVLALPTLLISLDQSVLYLALPHLAEDLGPTGTQTLWIMDIYGFLIAGFLITMGTLGDRIGRRKLLMIGAAAVGATSVAAACSTSAQTLILSRALLGIAAATLMPSTLALIGNMFRDPNQRGRAIAVWASCFMGGTALGPVVGGIFLEHFWWGSVFLLGVPVMAVLLIAAPRLLPEYKDPDAGRIDLFSVLLSLVSVLSVIYGLKELARGGFDLLPLVAVFVGPAVGTVFVKRQGRLEHPLLDLKLFRVGAFTAALLILMVSMLGTGGGYLFITGFLQMVEGYSPMEAGLLMVPAAVASILAAQVAPVLARRLSTGTVVGSALIVGTVGYLLLALVDPVGGMPLLMTGFVIIFVGVGTFGSLGTGLVVGSVPPERGGAAAALSSISGDLGNALGVATLGSLGAGVYRSSFDAPAGTADSAARSAGAGMESAVAVARDLPAQAGEALLTAARSAYSSGLNSIGIACALITATSAVIALTVLRERAGDAPSGARAPEADGPQQAEDTGVELTRPAGPR
ncbi:Antiseptic resistance protein [Streptomyces sp. YIM 130001]|uniref:MFS transporter n=1 Tax=Streptomyces sp. YIM 130001 TaxID=2259644 RepID=UPI000E648339|nr:MFS transporter [Streptomyces sp. YIM 130001]RII15808.1 Antiseptic resistance protein [Streptomyces sp. YIM 130001]